MQPESLAEKERRIGPGFFSVIIFKKFSLSSPSSSSSSSSSSIYPFSVKPSSRK